MKRLTYLLLALAVVALSACNNDKPTPNKPQPNNEVMSAEFISDVWSLVEWNTPIADGVYCYMELDGESGRFEMWDNLSSMYAHHTTGSFTLSKVDERDYITGTYDNGVGDWSDSYELIIEDFEYVDWVSQTTGDVLRFKRIFDLPELENN